MEIYDDRVLLHIVKNVLAEVKVKLIIFVVAVAYIPHA
jgi:hypothetical protein